MELFSQKVERSELNPGDHIYSWRTYIYNHHGIYIGDGKIIHFVSEENDKLVRLPLVSSSGGKKKITCPNSFCGTEEVDGSGVKMSCINCFIKKGSLYLFKYNASREFVVLKRGGTCTTARSDPSEEVIRRARYLFEKGYEEYDLMNNNCEDFALYCKTGLLSKSKQQQGRSSQANMVRRTSPPNQNGEIGKFMLRIVTAVPRSYSKREINDLGMRQDLVKIAVEDLSPFLRSLK